MSARGVFRVEAKAMADIEAKEFLAGSCVGHLATVGSDGYPRTCVVAVDIHTLTGKQSGA